MKKLITTNTYSDDDIHIDSIKSITWVEDATKSNPRDYAIYGASEIDYSTLTREQLLQLPQNELEAIRDVRILRKLKKSDLTIMQQRLVTQANKENEQSKLSLVKEVVKALKSCPAVYVERTVKNDKFAKQIWELGGQLSSNDVLNIVRNLHVKDYSYSTRSYFDENWCALLMVFEYNEPYTFQSRFEDGDPVTVDSFDVYIKIDVDTDTDEGYSVLSFHNPEYSMSHPYADFPMSKE